ncbi:MAG: hypothetical protein Q7T03_09215 [Deltaproteobacteria bacterium]|nr:hypothetical protein [Deltaproteobacteria bacterium]
MTTTAMTVMPSLTAGLIPQPFLGDVAIGAPTGQIDSILIEGPDQSRFEALGVPSRTTLDRMGRLFLETYYDSSDAPHITLRRGDQHQRIPTHNTLAEAGIRTGDTLYIHPQIVRASGADDNDEDPPFAFTIRRSVSAVQKNLEDLSVAELRPLLNGPQGMELRRRLMEEMLLSAQSGFGVDVSSLPPVLHQRGFSCAYYAILNGMRAVGLSEETAEFLDTFGVEIRARVLTATGATSGSAQDMYQLAVTIMNLGFPLDYINYRTNPLALVRLMAKPQHFLGSVRGEGSGWHATTFLLVQNPTAERFVVEIDSLLGSAKTWSMKKFFDYLVEITIMNDYHLVLRLIG